MSRLVKRFRYLDQSGAPLMSHVDHWRGFTWQAGPVCVIHKGLEWGTPQVWSATVEEGKRVIRHAAEIAGVDLDDPRGSWVVTGSLNPRYGRSGAMAVRRLRGGFLAVTKRDGPAALPDVARPDP